jgi:hypothetical protein
MSGTNGTNYEENASNSDGTTTLTVQLNTDMSAAHRFPAWLLLTVSSVICIIALQSRRGIFDVDGPGEAWVLSVGIISFFFSLVAVVMYLCFRMVFVGAISCGMERIQGNWKILSYLKPTFLFIRLDC